MESFFVPFARHFSIFEAFLHVDDGGDEGGEHCFNNLLISV